MTYNWRALAPHRPMSVSDVQAGELYVPRTGQGADAMGRLLDAGLERPIALFGPAGSGKSTELAALAEKREASWIGPLCRLDKELTYGDTVSVDDVLETIAKFAIRFAVESLHLNLSDPLGYAAGYPGLEDAMIRLRNLTHRADGHPKVARPVVPHGFDLLLATVRELRSASGQKIVALLVDGLEKASVGLATRTLVQLERLSGEAHVIVVVPTSIATGPAATVLHDYHVMSIGPVIVKISMGGVTAETAEKGVLFLLAIAQRRLGIASLGALEKVLRASARVSGGLVRTFLQLLQSAAVYAEMQGRETPEIADLTQAARDQTSFLLRLLKEGDAEALRAAHGTNGREIEIDRRVRFLANGLLLEYATELGTVVQVAPLLYKGLFGTADV